MRGRRFFAACVVAAGAACGPSALEDLTRGRGPDAGAFDAGAVDGKADASRRSCASTFCDDFDDGPLGSRWTGQDVNNGAEMTLVDINASPPFALRAAFPGHAANTKALLKKYVGGRKQLRCELDLLLLAPPAEGEIDYLAFVSQSEAAPIYRVYFAIFDNTWNLAEYAVLTSGGKLDRAKDMPPPPIDRWTHVVFDTDGQSTSISFDGKTAATLTGLSTIALENREIHVGITFASQTAPANAALFDNVACDYGL